MAFLIPENIRTNGKVPNIHRRVASLLAIGLEDSVTAWYEAPFDPSGERPPFVVLDPTVGVVVIDILDHQAGDRLEPVSRSTIRVNRSGETIEVANPMERAERFANALAEALSHHAPVSDVPVVALAAATHLAADHAEESGLTELIPRRRLILKEDHDTVLAGDDGDTVLSRMLLRAAGGAPDEPLAEEAQSLLRAVIHPDTVISTLTSGSAASEAPDSAAAVAATDDATDRDEASLFSPAELGEDDVVKVMDRRQERVAKSLGTGHRVIRGVAGSGKTLILLHRAREMARLFPTRPILVTCYTKSLASQLREQLAEFDNVQVVNLDSLMLGLVNKAGLDFQPKRDGWDSLPALARQALEVRDTRFQAVMVDEAQDFNTDALAFCVELLEATDAADQDLIIVADSAQNVFRRDFRWKDAGIQAQGRTRVLRVNYRNTREILRFAHDFLVADRTITVSEDGGVDDELAVIPAESAERSGPSPVVVSVGAAGEADAVVDQVRGWYSPELPARSIAVLIHGRGHARLGRPIVDRLRAAGISCTWITDPNEKQNKDRAGSVDTPVVVSTIFSAKGLEYPQVVVCGVGTGPNPSRDDLIADRKALYVGFTRAVDELTVVTTPDNPFSPDLA